MHKSTNDSTDDTSNVVSRLNVGQRVLVSGRFGGTLRYVGKVINKDGIFCGVELDQPIGKHDGTYRSNHFFIFKFFQDISYFDCAPNHGIFAPTYKVQLQSSNKCTSIDKPSYIQRPNKLVKSSIPSLSFSKLSNAPHQMDFSLMSTTSSGMDSSFILSESDYEYGNCGENDMMMNSAHTYTDCLMLSDIEISDSNLLHLDDEDENDMYLIKANRNARNLLGLIEFVKSLICLDTGQSTSVVLEQPSVDLSLLPVICGESSEEEYNDIDLPTPMVDQNYGLSNTISTNSQRTSESSDTLNIKNDVINHNGSKKSMPNNIQEMDYKTTDIVNGNGDQKQNKNRTNLSLSNNIKKTTSDNSKKSETLVSKKAVELIEKPPITTTSVILNNKTQKQQQQTSPKSERKKTKPSLKEIMEMTPKVPIIRPPKAPSKSQASIEADKKKPPKKAVQSKLAAIIRTPTNDENLKFKDDKQ